MITLWEEFLPDLLFGVVAHILAWTITIFPVKNVGIALSDPTQAAQKNCTTSYMVTWYLVSSLCGSVEFCSMDYTQLMTNGRSYIWSQKEHEAKNSLSANLG